MAENTKVKASVKPIYLKNTENNDVYVLEFSRDSIRFAENNGFRVSTLDEGTMTGIEDFFYYAFRMHHPKISRADAMRILYEDMGGMPKGMIERLGELYAVPLNTLVQDTERKNSKITVEF